MDLKLKPISQLAGSPLYPLLLLAYCASGGNEINQDCEIALVLAVYFMKRGLYSNVYVRYEIMKLTSATTSSLQSATGAL